MMRSAWHAAKKRYMQSDKIISLYPMVSGVKQAHGKDHNAIKINALIEYAIS